MAKKKGELSNKMCDRLRELLEAQEWRLKDIISKFYPDGFLVKFTDISNVEKIMATHPAIIFQRGMTKCPIRKESLWMDFDCLSKQMTFQNAFYGDFKACIMMKASSYDKPIYTYIGWYDIDGGEGAKVRFLVDNKNKVYLLLDYESSDEPKPDLPISKFCSKFCSIMELEEFHALVCGFSYTVEDFDPECFMVSFSKESGKCNVERIFGDLETLTDKLLRLGAYSGLGSEPPKTNNEDGETLLVPDKNEVTKEDSSVETVVKDETNEASTEDESNE